MNKNLNIKTSFIAVLSLFSMLTTAQNLPKVFGKEVASSSINPENGKIRCASTEYEAYLKSKHPERTTSAEFEAWLAPKIEEVKRKQRMAPPNTTAIITIPVVVHVIHNGDPVGRNENIADQQVFSQITVLNQDYRRMAGTPGENNNAVGADIEIEFCLATIDPNGNPTNGIDRVAIGNSSLNEREIETQIKPATYWDPYQYFNIWVCNFGGDLSDVLGYAQFPTASGLIGLNSDGGSLDTDGVAINYQNFGSRAIYPQGNYSDDYDGGRTTTHEIGHALGLIHIWGDGDDCNATDYCADTPPSNQANYRCAPHFSCQSFDMIENYMDYTTDACMSVFTKSQKQRIQAVLLNSERRSSLTYSTMCGTLSNPDIELLYGINLYPNPANDVLNIAVASTDLPDSFTIYNNIGQTVATTKVNSNASLTINTSAYSSGIYFIKIDKGTQTKTLKFIKN